MPRFPSACRAGLLLVLAAALPSGPARADENALDSNNFSIDTYSGLQIGSIRTYTLGGAYAAIAERAQGIMYNPAAVGQRVWYTKDLFDYDVGYAYLKPGLLFREDTDIDNDGDRSFNYSSYVAGVVYGALRVKKVGGGGLVRLQRFVLNDENGLRMPVTLGHADMAGGLSILSDFIVIGGGIRLVFMDVKVRGAGVEKSNALSYLSTGLVAGVLFRFKKIPLRIGLGAALPLPRTQTSWTEGVATCAGPEGSGLSKVGVEDPCGEGGLVIPDGIAFPWSIRLGFAYAIGKIKWNESWQYASRQYEYSNKVPTMKGDYRWSPWRSQYQMKRSDMDRRYVLFSLDIEVVGGVKNGIGLEGFLDQKWKRSTGTPTVSIHGGLESEVVGDWLVLRLGAYAEPSRFKRLGFRGHGTFGFDLKLFSLCWGSSQITFRGSAGFDMAAGYFNTGFSVGFWK
jgi:hypothetical protein